MTVPPAERHLIENSKQQAELVQCLLHAATLAPSPDNNQPWRFWASNTGLDIYLDRARALRSDVESMFDLTAIGAAIENVCIAARERGMTPNVHTVLTSESFSGSEPFQHVARITWSRGASPDPLADQLKARHTSRKPYSRQPIETGLLHQLAQAAQPYPPVTIHWLDSRPRIERFGRLVSLSDRLRFEHKSFHDELYAQMRLIPADAATSRDGLDLRVLELPPGGSLVLRLLQNWRLLAAANYLGASRCLARPSMLSVLNSGAIGLVAVDKPSSTAFVDGGRSFQRLWLTAAANGLQLHPLGGLPIFVAHHERLKGRYLTANQRLLASRVAQQFRELVPETEGKALQIAFRIGYGPVASFRSLRRPVSEVLGEPR